MTKPHARGLIGALLVAAACLVLATSSAASQASLARVPEWTSATRDTVRTHFVRKSGGEFYESGSATGTFPASVSGRARLGVIGHFTFILTNKHGSILVAGVGYPVRLGIHARFRGTARIVRGTGLYGAAHGSAALTADVDRMTRSIVGTVTGTVVL